MCMCLQVLKLNSRFSYLYTFVLQTCFICPLPIRCLVCTLWAHVKVFKLLICSELSYFFTFQSGFTAILQGAVSIALLCQQVLICFLTFLGVYGFWPFHFQTMFCCHPSNICLVFTYRINYILRWSFLSFSGIYMCLIIFSPNSFQDSLCVWPMPSKVNSF